MYFGKSIATVVIAFSGVALLSGCGMNTVNEGKFVLNLSESEVMAAFEKRSTALKPVGEILKRTSQLPELIEGWSAKSDVVLKLSGKVTEARATGEDGRVVALELNSMMRDCNEDEKKVLKVAEKLMSEKNFLGKSELATLENSVAEYKEKSKLLQIAVNKHEINVKTFNEVVGMWPTRWTAKLLGSGPSEHFNIDVVAAGS